MVATSEIAEDNPKIERKHIDSERLLSAQLVHLLLKGVEDSFTGLVVIEFEPKSYNPDLNEKLRVFSTIKTLS